MAQDSEKIVGEFIKSWSSGDMSLVLSFLAEDCVYHNMPLAPLKGRAAVAKELGYFLDILGNIEVTVLKTLASGNVVVNERIDSFTKDGRRLDLPVAGVFELTAGKISAWRDYFDMAAVTKFIGGS